MPSQLVDNENISFICGRNFEYKGRTYKVGQDFPKEDLVTSPETLVRTRHLIPVVESRSDKPRHWHREVQEKDVVLRKLGVEEQPQSEEQEAEVEELDEFDPSEHTVEEIEEYLAQPDLSVEEYNRVIQAEEDGKARKTLLENHEKIEE